MLSTIGDWFAVVIIFDFVSIEGYSFGYNSWSAFLMALLNNSVLFSVIKISLYLSNGLIYFVLAQALYFIYIN